MNTAYIAITLGGLSPENVETIYNKRLQSYYFDHSREVKFTPDYDGKEYDTQGNIINAEFDKIYKTGVPIPEKDFIKQQLDSIEKVNLKGLKQEYKALLNYYKDYLEIRLNATNEPQQSIEENPDEVKRELHNHIFKDNAFEVWQNMFEKFNINKSKRTDIDFMFEVMKYNNLIHENIGFKDIVNWINTVYEITFDKIKYTNPISKANEKRLIIYNEIKSK